MSKWTSIDISDTFHDRYKIISKLGKGGMGTVYLAEDLRLKGKNWAIKEINIQESDYKQFVDEAKILITLEHPYLPKIIDYYSSEDEGLCYLVKRYINGRTLKEIFEKASLSINQDCLIKYALQLCDLFDYLHNKQSSPVIYRDLKPSNIMIDEFDNVRLIDFGIARNYKEGKKIDTIQLGTVGFAAPEQFEDKQTDQRSDIYSLGALMYYLLSNGKYYYLTQKPLNHFRNDLNISLLNIINKMLKINPEERYQNIHEVKIDLEKLNQNHLDITEKIDIEINEIDNSNMFDRNKKNIYSNYQEITSIVSTKQILITNLSKRAGSTFLTVNLAKYLSEFNISTCIIEPPFEPYIFDYVGLEQRLNVSGHPNQKDLYSFAHEIFAGKKIEKEREILDEGIFWMIIDPRKKIIDKTNWTYNHMLKLLYSSRKAKISIIDVGDYLEHDSIKPLLDEVDLVLIIVDPMPSEITLNLEKIERLLKAKDEGVPIEFIINKWTENINLSELMEVIGCRPATFIPNIDLSYIHKAVYRCEIPYSYKEIRLLLEKPFNKIAKIILPDGLNYYKKETKNEGIKIFKWLRR